MSTQGGFFTDVNKLFATPGFQNLLAGVGAGLDPQGFGGALGNATIAYNKSRVAADLAAKNEKARQEARSDFRSLVDILSGPKSPGVTSMSRGDDGQLTIKLTPEATPPVQDPGATAVEILPSGVVQPDMKTPTERVPGSASERAQIYSSMLQGVPFSVALG